MTLDSFQQPERPARTAGSPRRQALAALLAAWLCAVPAHAAEAPPAPDTAASAPAPNDAASDGGGATGLRFNGFGTLGLVDVSPSDAWGLRREENQPAHHDDSVRWDVDSRLGLQANWSPNERWDLVGQVVLKPYAHTATYEQALAWAFAAFHPTPDWTVRVGRTSPDLFLLSDVRNVGFAYPWIRPSQDFYAWVPVSNLDGADVARQWNLGGMRWRAKLFGGRSKVTLASAHDDGDTGASTKLAGGTLTVDDDGLTLKATYAEAHTHPDNAASVAQLDGAFDALVQLGIPVVSEQAAVLRGTLPSGTFLTRYSALSAAWEHDAWQLQAEFARTNGNFSISNGWYGYMSAAWRTGNKTFFGMVGRSRETFDPLPEPNWAPVLTPLVGPVLAGEAQYAGTDIADSYNLAREDQRSLSLGMRIDLNAQLALKLQFDDFLTAHWGGGMWAYDTADSHHARVFSAGLDFIF